MKFSSEEFGINTEAASILPLIYSPTIDPRDAHRLKNGKQKQGHSTAGVVVKQLEDVQAPLCGTCHVISRGKDKRREEGCDNAVCSYFSRHGKTDEEANNTNGNKEKFASMANVEEGRIHVRNRSDESFQTDKLEHSK